MSLRLERILAFLEFGVDRIGKVSGFGCFDGGVVMDVRIRRESSCESCKLAEIDHHGGDGAGRKATGDSRRIFTK